MKENQWKYQERTQRENRKKIQRFCKDMLYLMNWNQNKNV